MSFFEKLLENELAPILTATARTTQERLLLIKKYTKGFLYYEPQREPSEMTLQCKNLSEQFENMRDFLGIPVVEKMEIFNKKEAAAVLNYSNGFLIKTALVQHMANKPSLEEMVQFIKAMDPRPRH